MDIERYYGGVEMVQPIKSQTYPLLPLRGTLVFPYMVTPLEVGRVRSIEAVEQTMLRDGRIVLAAQHLVATEDPQPEDIYDVGTLCEVKQLLKVPEGQIRVLVEGISRVNLEHIDDAEGYYEAFVTPVPETVGEMDRYEREALMRIVREEFEKYVRLGKKIPAEVLLTVSSIEDVHRFADTIASQLNVAFKEKQRLLEIFPVDKRLEAILGLLYREGEILSMEKNIQQRVRKQMEKAQREYYLREQIKAIQMELGERDERGSTEIDELKDKLEKAKLPKEAKAKVLHEIHRLERMAPMAAEATVVRNYIDWMLALPWSKRTKDRLDLNVAEELLDRDHFGLDKVKERILEFLAVRQLTKSSKGPILCLVGPPGVGKTSLAQSVGTALNRNFSRLSLGGVRDEAEIRGHRRTYIGSMPGRIIQTLKTVGSLNPVIVLDEVDKLASDFRGDPASALLEVLDPEQNHRFGDHYLEVPFDLSEILFITTANVLHSIPPPLRDRMEVIEIPGYTEYEKFEIARRHLWPKQYYRIKKEYITDESLKAVFRTLRLDRVELIEIQGDAPRQTERGLQQTIRCLAEGVLRRLIDTKPIQLRSGRPYSTDEDSDIVRIMPTTMKILGICELDKAVIEHRGKRVVLRALEFDSFDPLLDANPLVYDEAEANVLIGIPAKYRHELGILSLNSIVTVSRDMQYLFVKNGNHQVLPIIGVVFTILQTFQQPIIFIAST
jgi:ATP-dependent Lon protease